MHNMSIMSHLSVDPAAMAQASMLHHGGIGGLDMSQLGLSAVGGAALDTSAARINDDRL